MDSFDVKAKVSLLLNRKWVFSHSQTGYKWKNTAIGMTLYKGKQIMAEVKEPSFSPILSLIVMSDDVKFKVVVITFIVAHVWKAAM
jgi:hypothetical protein